METRPPEETPTPSAVPSETASEPSAELTPEPVAAAEASQEAAPETAPAEDKPADTNGEGGEPAGPGDANWMGEAATPGAVNPKKGDRVSGKIVKIGADSAFVDFGGREEGAIDLKELLDAEGKPTQSEGDSITATVTQVEGGIKLTVRSAKRGDIEGLLDASKNNVPVQGRVTGVNKGGLVVRVLGVRAFCPLSQIDRQHVEDPSQFVGKTLTFRISSADAKGKNVVLSRRALLEEQTEELAKELRGALEIGQEREGKVVRIKPFGAFVDLGGLDGLVHVSELSHSRVKDAASAVKVGESVRVKIVGIENLGQKDERISLSMKQLQEDPWLAAAQKFEVGTQAEGKVVRVVDFGAFVELAPGVDGLVHVSAMADGRVQHPNDVVKVGDSVNAWITKLDSDSKRISLSLVEPSGAPAERPPRSSGGGKKRSQGPKVHRAAPDPQQAPGMTSMEEAFQRLRERQAES